MGWLEKVTAPDALLLGAGTLLAFFGYDFFRLARKAVGAVAGALCGLAVYLLIGVPAAVADLGVGPVVWMVVLAGVFAMGGALLLRQVRTIGSFIPGVLLGFFAGKALLHWLGGREPLLSFSSLDALLAGISGGVAVLLHERMAVIVMTAMVGSYLAGSALPWKEAPLFFFAGAVPLQWWIQAGRPIPFRRRGEGE